MTRDEKPVIRDLIETELPQSGGGRSEKELYLTVTLTNTARQRLTPPAFHQPQPTKEQSP